MEKVGFIADDVIIATIKIVYRVVRESVNGPVGEGELTARTPSDVIQTTCHVVPNARYVIGVGRAR